MADDNGTSGSVQLTANAVDQYEFVGRGVRDAIDEDTDAGRPGIGRFADESGLTGINRY